MEIENSQITFKTIFRTILIALFFPAIVEEVFFRVLFLAHSTENTSIFNQYFFVIISLMIFVVYHPLNAYLFVYNARKTFNSFVFLTSAAILGIVCTIAYLKSGSIYPPVIIHWIIVIFWLLIFGGYRKLYL
ncbi:MAG: CPBP family glutamic-type intramembrane protease [Cyanobacteria bacterium J06621_8]